MNRPTGVTAAAVVQVLGSLVCLAFAPLMMWTTRQPGMPPAMGNAGIIVGVFYAAFGALGIATAVGLLRMRAWARVSTLVFAGFLALVCVMAMLVLVFAKDMMPPPTDTAVSPRLITLTTAGVLALPLLISVWWLVYFTRRSVREAFAGVPGSTPGGRPVSISIIGWIYVISSVASIVPAALGLPAYLFGAILTGWSAILTYVVIGAIGGSLGWGVLQLREQARVLMLGWLGFTAVHMAFMALAPGQFARMQAAMPSALEGQPAFVPNPSFTAVMMLPTLVLIALAAWFLVKEKAAFTKDGTQDAASGR